MLPLVLTVCSYGAACLRASPVLVLTLVGGGVFANPEEGAQLQYSNNLRF